MTRSRLGISGIAGLLLACAGTYAAPAAAQVHAELAATNLRYTLIDLTPDDGETPWVHFTSADWRPISWSGSIVPDTGGEQSQQFLEEHPIEFELSPHARLSFRYDTHLAMHAPMTDPRQYADAEIYSHMEIGWGSGKGRVSYSYNAMGDNAWVGQQEWSGGADFYRDSYGESSASTEREVAVGSYYLHADARIYAAAAPVPEAPMPAMLLSGLGLLGVLARRRSGRRG